MTIKRPRRAKKKRFHTGTYTSTKTGKSMVYRSSWELEFMQYLDSDDTVALYSYESVIVPYRRSLRSIRISKYIVDFRVEYTSGVTVLYEIKSSSFVNRRVNVAKFGACRTYCEQHGWQFSVLTEVELRAMGLLKRKVTGVLQS